MKLQDIVKNGRRLLQRHEADLDAHTYEHFQKLRTGGYFCTPREGSVGTRVITADHLYAIPFVAARKMTVDRIACWVQSLVNPSNIRIGIYADGTNCYPGALVLDAGAVSGATVGGKIITIDQQLDKGLYWLALVSDAAPTFYGTLGQGNLILGLVTTGYYYYYIGWDVVQAYGALPDPFTAGGSLVQQNTKLPNLSMRLASLD